MSFVSVRSDFSPTLISQPSDSEALQPLHTDVKDHVSESPLYLNFASITVCFHFLWRLAKRLFLGFHFVCSELPDHARSRLGRAVPSGCPDGKNLTIAFSARGFILSFCFTTWAVKIEFILKNELHTYYLIFPEAYGLPKERFFVFFLFVIN